MDRALQNSFGNCSSLQELAEKYRYGDDDDFGIINAMMLFVVREALLLECVCYSFCSHFTCLLTARRTVSHEPLLLEPSGPKPELVGISGGLFSAVVVPISTDFESLYNTCLEAGRVWARICNLTVIKTRAIEDCPGFWGSAVLGISADELGKTLEQFQNTMVIRFHDLDTWPQSADSNSIGCPVWQKSPDWCCWRSVDRDHRTAFYLRTRFESMSLIEQSSKKRVEYSCYAAHP